MSTKTCTRRVKILNSDERYRQMLGDIESHLATESDTVRLGDLRCLRRILEYGLRTGQAWPGIKP